VPVCADGGVSYSGDIVIALAIGAKSVMFGSLIAGTTESPGEIVYPEGVPMKLYRGMSSLGAMQDSRAARQRYGQADCESNKLVPEGIESYVPFKGDVSDIIVQCLGGIRSGLGYIGARNISALQERADLYYISGAGLSESHPHGVKIARKSPNYPS
jgi:IMP dehydrogenase